MNLEELIIKAQIEYEKKNLETALQYYLEAEKKISYSSTLFIQIALIYDELNDYERAKYYYGKILDYDINHPIAYYGLATIYDNLKDYDKAIAYYKEAIRLDETYYQAHFFLANIYDEINEIPLAIHHYKKVIELNPQYFYAYLNLGSLYETMNKDELALNLFKKAENLKQDNHLLYFNFGVVYKKMGFIDLSIENYQYSIELNQNYPNSYLNLAIIHKDEKKDLTKAIETYTKGIQNNPDEVVLYYNRACSYALTENFVQAVADLEKATKENDPLYKYMMKDPELQKCRQSDVFKLIFINN